MRGQATLTGTPIFESRRGQAPSMSRRRNGGIAGAVRPVTGEGNVTGDTLPGSAPLRVPRSFFCESPAPCGQTAVQGRTRMPR